MKFKFIRNHSPARRVLLCMLIAPALLLDSCYKSDQTSPADTKSPGNVSAAGGKVSNQKAGGGQPVPVHVAKAVAQRVPIEVSTFGNVEAINTINVTAQVSGQLTDVLFKEGDHVTEGQPLFKIDPRPFAIALSQAEAAYARANADAKQAEANLTKDQAMAANASTELDRNKTLLQKKMVSQEEYDQSRTANQSAQAVAGATGAALASAREQIRAAQSAIDSAQLNLSYASIASPITGRTGSLKIQQGNIIKANDANPLVTITQVQPIYVSFTLPEKYLARLRARMQSGTIPVRVSIPDSTPPASGQPPAPDKDTQGTTNADAANSQASPPVTGDLTFIDNTVDRTTSTIRLKATFANAGETLWPGQYVRVSVELGSLENAVTIPAQAIQTNQNGPNVYVVLEGGKPDLRKVKLGPTWRDLAVIEEGVSAGEDVVTDGQLRISLTGTVQILNTDAHGDAGEK